MTHYPAPLLAPQDPARALALDARFYVDPALHQFERRAIFARSWQLLAHDSRLATPGTHVVDAIADTPVLVVRDDAESLRLLHNVCRHRAGPLATSDGCAKFLRCQYHGWTYGLDGVLRGAPEMGRAPDFDPARIALPQGEVAAFRGLVFGALERPPTALDELLADVAMRLGTRGFDGWQYGGRASYEVACNWKVYVDNYLEGYHVPHIHPTLNAVLDYTDYETTAHAWSSVQASPISSGDALYGSGEALYWYIWPNTMLNFLPGRLQTNRVVPLAPDRCRVDFVYYYDLPAGEALARFPADHAFSDPVQAEDGGICEAVQRGLSSGSYSAGRLNPDRENAVLHFHELLRRTYRDGGLDGASAVR
jgi:choline monooxygenase